MLVTGLADEDKKRVRLLVGAQNSATGQAIHEQEKYMQEIADHLNRHLTAGVADKEMGSAKIDPAAQNSLNGEGFEVESAQTETEWEGPTLRSRIIEYVHSLSATLVALTALGLLGLLFFVVRVASVFSGVRQSANRRGRR